MRMLSLTRCSMLPTTQLFIASFRFIIERQPLPIVCVDTIATIEHVDKFVVKNIVKNELIRHRHRFFTLSALFFFVFLETFLLVFRSTTTGVDNVSRQQHNSLLGDTCPTINTHTHTLVVCADAFVIRLSPPSPLTTSKKWKTMAIGMSMRYTNFPYARVRRYAAWTLSMIQHMDNLSIFHFITYSELTAMWRCKILTHDRIGLKTNTKGHEMRHEDQQRFKNHKTADECARVWKQKNVSISLVDTCLGQNRYYFNPNGLLTAHIHIYWRICFEKDTHNIRRTNILYFRLGSVALMFLQARRWDRSRKLD